MRVFKDDYFVLPSFLVPKLRSVVQNEWKKHPYIFLSTFGSKINEFERKNWKGFCIKINCSQMKLLNFENWTNGEPQ